MELHHNQEASVFVLKMYLIEGKFEGIEWLIELYNMPGYSNG